MLLATSRILEICNNGCVPDATTFGSSSTADKRFVNEATRKSYLPFRKFEVKESIETSVLSITRHESIMVCIVNDLSYQPEINEMASSPVIAVGEHSAFISSSADTDLT